MRTFDEIYTNLEELIRDDYRSVVKALLSIEYGIYDDADSHVFYDEYMQNDTMTL